MPDPTNGTVDIDPCKDQSKARDDAKKEYDSAVNDLNNALLDENNAIGGMVVGGLTVVGSMAAGLTFPPAAGRAMLPALGGYGKIYTNYNNYQKSLNQIEKYEKKIKEDHIKYKEACQALKKCKAEEEWLRREREANALDASSGDMQSDESLYGEDWSGWNFECNFCEHKGSYDEFVKSRHDLDGVSCPICHEDSISMEFK